ncbi:hypothetical protein GGP51_003222 [Salinibacter ruber]|nr:hypothetical protein [Salinibacter ruber]
MIFGFYRQIALYFLPCRFNVYSKRNGPASPSSVLDQSLSRENPFLKSGTFPLSERDIKPLMLRSHTTLVRLEVLRKTPK